MLIPAKIALESCCLSYFNSSLLESVGCQSELWSGVCFKWGHLDGFGLILLFFTLVFHITAKFPHPVSHFGEFLSWFLFVFWGFFASPVWWHSIFRNNLVRSKNSTLQTAFHQVSVWKKLLKHATSAEIFIYQFI